MAIEAFAGHAEDLYDPVSARTFVGGGGRFRLRYEPDFVALNAGAGAFTYREGLNPLYELDGDEQSARLNFYLAYKRRISETAEAASTTYFHPPRIGCRITGRSNNWA